MVINLFKVIGAIGILLIAIGILNKKRKTQNVYYAIGGLCLLTYSIYINDLVFIILQIIFTTAAIYDLIKTKK